MVLDTLLFKVHPIVIHFTIVGYSLAFMAAVLLQVFDMTGRVQLNDFTAKFSLVNFWIASLFYPIVSLTGILDANGIESAIARDLLALKIAFGFVTALVILIAVVVLLVAWRQDKSILTSTSLRWQYILLTGILWVLILYIAGLGGLYVFGHTLFDNIGLGFLIPRSIEQPTGNLFDSAFEALFFSPLATGVLSIVFLVLMALFWRLSTKS